MSKQIKFRVFNTQTKRMFQWDELINGWTFEDIDRINKKDSVSKLIRFTGVKGKSKVDIYEGDIIERADIKYEVIFHCGEWAFTAFGEGYKKYFYSLYRWGKNFKVVGNIYENPKLKTNPRISIEI